MCAFKGTLERFTKVAQQMEAVCNLNSSWCACCCTTNILWAAVTSDNLDARMLLEPHFQCCRTTLRQ